MRAWLIQISEVLPIDGESPRLARMGQLAAILAERGHTVDWWASTFDYRLRSWRASETTTVSVAPSYRLHLLHAGGYMRNVSLERLRYQRSIAQEFRRASALAPRPDVILCSYPTIELALAAAEYGHRHGIPVVLDVRDMWPDIFLRLVPRGARHVGEPLARLALAPMVSQARRAFRLATAITGNTRDMVEWALRYGGRDARPDDRDFPHGYAQPPHDERALADARSRWRERGIAPEAGEFLIVFFGAFARAPEFDTVLEAARLLEGGPERARFVLCGTGPREAEIRARAAERTNVTVPGWIGADDIWALMEMSAVGLLCYHSTFDFEASIPNKPIEYLAGGLPVLSSLERGVLRDLLAAEDCGRSYRNGHPDELAAIVRELAHDSALHQRLSARARSVFERYFESSRVYGAFADHLERLAARRGPPDIASVSRPA